MGSLAIMKMVQQDDQTQIYSASESLSRDLIDQLTNLNSGEAIFSGQWVNIPAFVKIDEVKERKIGGDQKSVEQWEQLAEMKEMAKKDASDSYIPPGYIDNQ